jgi:tetratricopeptide (TPR) repeat protein
MGRNPAESVLLLERSLGSSSFTNREVGKKAAFALHEYTKQEGFYRFSPESRLRLFLFLIEQFESTVGTGVTYGNTLYHLLLIQLYHDAYGVRPDERFLERARELLDGVKQISPQRTEVNSFLGYQYFLEKRYDDALAIQKKSISLAADQDKPRLQWGLARIALKAGLFNEAFDALQHALDSGYGIYKDDTLVLLFATEVSEEFFGRALSYIVEGIKENPQSLRFRGAKVVLLEKMGKKEEADIIFREIKTKNPQAAQQLERLLENL